MRKYNWVTDEYEEIDVYCYNCGELIDGQKGYREQYVDDGQGGKKKIILGSCCVGKIHAYGSISKSVREKYRNQGQISEEVLSKNLPLAPKPTAKSDQAGKEVHKFVDGILKNKGRSKLIKSYDGQIKYKKRKNLKGE